MRRQSYNRPLSNGTAFTNIINSYSAKAIVFGAMCAAQKTKTFFFVVSFAIVILVSRTRVDNAEIERRNIKRI